MIKGKVKYPCSGCKNLKADGNCYLGWCYKWKRWFTYQWNYLKALFGK